MKNGPINPAFQFRVGKVTIHVKRVYMADQTITKIDQKLSNSGLAAPSLVLSDHCKRV
jgi:hypothetical protein